MERSSFETAGSALSTKNRHPAKSLDDLSGRERAFIKAYRKYMKAVATGACDHQVLELAKAAAEALNTRIGVGGWLIEGGDPTPGISVGVFWSAREATMPLPRLSLLESLRVPNPRSAPGIRPTAAAKKHSKAA